MNLKDRMEAIWNNGGCVCPNHKVQWFHESSIGYMFWIKTNVGMIVALNWKHGTRVRLKGKRPKVKGYSFLMKGY